MRIAKPLLMVTTPIGLVFGLRECYRLDGVLVVIMLMMMLVIAAAFATLIVTVRRESRASREPAASPIKKPESPSCVFPPPPDT